MNLIVDASNIIHRSFWISQKADVDLPKEDSNLQALLFLKSLKMYYDMFKPSSMYCVWDDRIDNISSNFRDVISEGTYKAGRDPSRREQVYENLSTIIELVETLNGHNVYPHASEGDDVIAFLSSHLDGDSIIVSADKDLLQLITSNVSVYNVTKKVLITKSNFTAEVGYETVDDFLISKILGGDASDNIEKVLTPGKIKKYLSGCLKLTEEQDNKFKLNAKLMTLSPSIEYQEGEYDKLVNQVSGLNTNGSFKQFITKCREYGISSIVTNQFQWQNTFFGRPNMTNIVNMLGLHK
jgi:hypothetical protein